MSKDKLIIDGKATIFADNINAYLLDAPNVFLDIRSKPLCDVPPMILGSIPRDNGNLILNADELEPFLRKEPRAKKFIRQYVGADEFLNGKIRYCLWLVDATVEEIRSMPSVAQRVEAVRQFRLSSKRAATQKQAETPSLFSEIRQPTTDYITVPLVSSERRKYIPMGFMTPNIVVSNLVEIIPDADLFHFSILVSSVHMLWTSTVCGRLKSDYRYSGTIVYNNFPWLTPTEPQYHEIRRAAKAILDARALYPSWTLAQLYDPNKMPIELRAAHAHNDQLIIALYHFEGMTELEMITQLLLMYEELSE
ncbi:MAG: class I SAM-dependent DNA methyltransferase, partial [Selenomonadaceae bacterium]|nr:class I SAM-dependent DNA methyltransferase [Selenomonadaceae bacterium]